MKPAVRTARARDRRDSLLVSAQDAFEELGYFETRVADIAARSNVGHGTFYSYFESKDDVLRALIDTLVCDMLRATDPADRRDDSAWLHLRATIAAFMVAYQERAGMHRVLNQAVSSNPDFLARKLEIRACFNSRIQRSIEGWQQRGVGRPELDAKHAAHALGGMIEDAAYAHYVLGEPFDDDTLFDTLTSIWAHAVGIPGPNDRSLP